MAVWPGTVAAAGLRRKPAYDRLIRQCAQQFCHGAVQDGVQPVRSDFDQGHKDETALVEPGVRNEKAWFLDDAIVIEQDVQVECPWPSTMIEIPTQCPFDFL